MSGSGKGYVALDRAFFESWVWGLKPEQLKLFIWLIYRARWQRGASKVLLPGQTIVVERGQLWTTERKLASSVGMGRQAVRTALKLFEREGSILTQHLTHHGSLITIVKYETYQGGGWDGNPGANPNLTHGQPNKNQERKEPEEEEGPPQAASSTEKPAMVLNCKDGKAEITTSTLERWLNAYRSVDVQAELRHASEWHEAQPANRKKTIRGAERFLVGWLKRATQQASRSKPEGNGAMLFVTEPGGFDPGVAAASRERHDRAVEENRGLMTKPIKRPTKPQGERLGDAHVEQLRAALKRAR